MKIDATQIAAQIAAGETTATAEVDAAIARIEALNGSLNAVVSMRFDAAREEATRALKGPFAGVPILLKEMMPHPDWPSTMASRVFADATAGKLNEFGERIARAGFIVLGRTNSSELAALPTCEPDLFGPTTNPWKAGYDPGGSSGGAAAAVACGMVTIGQGGDAGGSLRIPASACGVFGFKPSRGTMPMRPGLGQDGLGIPHAITASVRDSWNFLKAVGGPCLGDRWNVQRGNEDIEAGLPRLRIGLLTRGFVPTAALDDACAAASLCAAQQAMAMGHRVTDLSLDLGGQEVNDAFLTAAGIASARLTMSLNKDQRALFGTWVAGISSWGASLSPWALNEASEVMQAASYRLADLFTDYDLLIAPVLARPPSQTGEFMRFDRFEDLREAMLAYAPHTPYANVTGVPAMSLPLAMSDAGLPIGVQIIGPWGSDALMHQFARSFEREGHFTEKSVVISN